MIPSLVGNVRNIIVSDQAGKSNIMLRLNKYGIKIDKNNPKVQTLLNEVKDREFVGYSYDGADATTRVSIESTDRDGKSWFTIGVSPNIIEASFKALIDSLDYKLYKEKAPANN